MIRNRRPISDIAYLQSSNAERSAIIAKSNTVRYFFPKHAHKTITFVERPLVLLAAEVVAPAAPAGDVIDADVIAVTAADGVGIVAGVALVEVGDGALVEVVVVVAVEIGGVLLRQVAVQDLSLTYWPSFCCGRKKSI